MRIRRVAGTILVFLAGVAWAQSAAAWGDLGHKVVCEIAFQGLNQKAKQEVVRLIRTDPDFKTFSDSCTWPDHPSQRAPEHFHQRPAELQPIYRCAVPFGVAVPVHRDHERLAGTPHPAERPGEVGLLEVPWALDRRPS